MIIEKKTARAAIYLPVFIILMILGGISIETRVAADLTDEFVSRKTTRLFGDMNVIGVERSDAPIDLGLADLNGKNVRLSDFKGKIVFLNFWTTWCSDCRIEMPAMEVLHQRLNHKDFVMIAVNLQEPAARVQEFFKSQRLTFTALLDLKGEAGMQLAVRAIPATFILNKKGIIIGKAYGARKWDSDVSIALFEHLISI